MQSIYSHHSSVRTFAIAILVGGVLSASAIELGPFTLGGAIRANYRKGNYEADNRLGKLNFDTFLISLDFKHENWIAAGQYRWYDGYNYFHTGWAGYESDAFGRLEVGLTRTPFGVGAYGPANNWFFDQHFYLGLSDKMKLGATYSRTFDRFSLDLGYYPMDMVRGHGDSSESARYSYAVVAEDVGGIPGAYEQRHQFNIRTTMDVEEINTTLGASAQWSILDAQDNRAEDSHAYAASLHTKSHYGDFGFMLQLTRFDFDVDYTTGSDGIRPPNNLINMGACDFAWPTAASGWVSSIAVSYTITPEINWIESVTFYNDYSIIFKDGSLNGADFNNSAMNVIGMVIVQGNWYLYIDYALSNGHYFIGDKDDVYGNTYADSAVGDFGANQNDKWKGRFNINLGYYF